MIFRVSLVSGKASTITSADQIAVSPNAKGNITIPCSIAHQNHEYIITTIKERSFKNNKNIRSIDFSPDSLIHTIFTEPFAYSSLEKITIHSNLTGIGDAAFSWCDKLKTIEIPTNSCLITINKEAFAHY